MTKGGPHRSGDPPSLRIRFTAAFVTGQILEVAGSFGLATPVYGDLMASASKR